MAIRLRLQLHIKCQAVHLRLNYWEFDMTVYDFASTGGAVVGGYSAFEFIGLDFASLGGAVVGGSSAFEFSSGIIGAGGSSGVNDSNFYIDWNKLSQILNSRDVLRNKLQKSYDEIVNNTSTSEVGKTQGIKQLAEYKKKLDRLIDGPEDLSTVKAIIKHLSLYLRTAYMLAARSR